MRNQLELGGKTIYVQRNSSFVQRLKNLSDEIGDSIIISEVDENVEELIEKVALGEIDYTYAMKYLPKSMRIIIPILILQPLSAFLRIYPGR